MSKLRIRGQVRTNGMRVGYNLGPGRQIASEPSGMELDFLRNRATVKWASGGTNYDGLPFVADGGPVQFSRATTATRINAAGIIETVAVNVPRLDHDPVTLEAKGLLIEEQRTNKLLNSATLVGQSVITTAAAHTLSFYGTGTVTLSGSHAATAVGTGAYPKRTTLTFTPTAGTLAIAVTGSVTDAQLEAGAFATSYIPTTAASGVTRSPEVCTMPTSAFPYNAVEGALTVSAAFSDKGRYATFRDAGHPDQLGNFIEIYQTPTSAAGFVYEPKIVQANLPSPAPENKINNVGLIYKTNDIAFCANGQTVLTDRTAVLPTVNQLTLNLYGGAPLGSGHIRHLAYIPRRITNIELQERTA